jgi:pSer/pThr/pTyr-binding forkhead associated (FHA) protein
MPILTLKFKNKSIGDYQLQKGVSLTIGRRKNNDVVIENLAVSGHHAKIDSVGDGFVLIDLKSKNGSFVNEQIINSHWLQQGDVINIGKHSLIFEYGEGEQIPDDDSDKIEKTMVMETSQYRSMVERSQPGEAIPPIRNNLNRRRRQSQADRQNHQNRKTPAIRHRG